MHKIEVLDIFKIEATELLDESIPGCKIYRTHRPYTAFPACGHYDYEYKFAYQAWGLTMFDAYESMIDDKRCKLYVKKAKSDYNQFIMLSTVANYDGAIVNIWEGLFWPGPFDTTRQVL